MISPLWVLLATAASAAPQTFVALEYEVAPDAGGCPEVSEFRANVERQLGYDPFRAAADQRVAVQIARKGSGFEARIRWSDDRGRWVGDRRLSSRRPSCDEIAANLAFSVAVQVQLFAALAPAAPPPPPVPPPAARAPEPSVVPALPPTFGSPAPAPVKRGRQLQLSVGLGPSLGLGLGPHPEWLGRIFVSGRVSWFSLEIDLDGALPVEQREVDGSGFSLDRYAAGAAACGHERAFAACVTATTALLKARGFGVDAPASPAGIYPQVGARLAATRALGGRYFAAARVDGLVMVSSATVKLNETAVWTTPRVGVLMGFDLGARFF